MMITAACILLVILAMTACRLIGIDPAWGVVIMIFATSLLAYYAVNSMKTGIIKRYWNPRGFGFILPDDDSKDVFLHVSVLHGETGDPALVQLLPNGLEGTRVAFTIKPMLGRSAAETIRKL